MGPSDKETAQGSTRAADTYDGSELEFRSTGLENNSTLDKFITLKPIIALGLSLQASWEIVAITFGFAFINGGPAALTYGMIIVTIGSAAVAASLGEMAAVDPAVGAQYRWTTRYALRNLRPQFWGFMQGWLTFLAWVAACTVAPYTIGMTLQAIAIFNYPTYDPKRWHLTMIGWGFIVIAVTCNFWARRIFVALELAGALAHFIFFLATVITLGVLVKKSSNDFVWNTVLTSQPASLPPAPPVFGWSNAGVAMSIGLLSPVTAVVGFDGIIHMSDETKHASKYIPRAMVTTVFLNGLLAWCFILALLYCFGDPNIALSPDNLPFINILYAATNSKAATNTFMSFLVLVFTISTFSAFASVSRLTWAFACDGGLPFSDTFGKVHPRLKVPVNALLLVATLNALLLLINIGSTTAFYAIVSLAVLALFISYFLPILFLVIRKLRGVHDSGPWRPCGRYSILMNIFALCYTLFMIIWLPFPTALPINENTMNYASPVWLGVVLFALVDYLLWGKTRFKLKA